jgi:hypothetical protein
MLVIVHLAEAEKAERRATGAEAALEPLNAEVNFFLLKV